MRGRLAAVALALVLAAPAAALGDTTCSGR
jgi:hypothetical protein